MMLTLEKAIEIAASAHEGQKDKGGAPYILHPLRVMMEFANTDEQIVAVLHDVVEDSHYWTIEKLRRQGLPERLCAALDAVTRKAGEDYADFIDRCADDPIARVVKMADLRDNLDLSRISGPNDADRVRMERYQRSLSYLDMIPHRPYRAG